MLSYRHGFHAGNSADVFKHSVLVFCATYLGLKEKSCLYVDTHAGVGLYSLTEGFAVKNREWENGIERLASFRPPAEGAENKTPEMLRRYLDLTRDFGHYPGSPALIRTLMREQDRACCFELHPADFEALKNYAGGDSRFTLRNEDGIKGLRGLLPPVSRRGLILIDPSYEIKEDFSLIPEALEDALGRFPQGIFIIWYPLLARGAESAGYAQTLLDLFPGNRCAAELYTADPAKFPAGAGTEHSPRGMYGSGLVIFNPPWTLKPVLEEGLPFLAECFGNPGGWRLDWFERNPRSKTVS
jgi:23S rRNA (adenine2030-N6)-methyltransferase